MRTTCRYCSDPVEAVGLCNRHYHRLRRHGNPLGRAEAYERTQDFKGLGIIKCGMCGKPTRDHSLTKPCAMADLR